MHYEQHVVRFKDALSQRTYGMSNDMTPVFNHLRSTTDWILQRINDRSGKIISVIPITEGCYDFNESDRYGWGASFTSAILYIVEYPD